MRKAARRAVPQLTASMKVPPKRKGNVPPGRKVSENTMSLNESPSEKEGKSPAISATSELVMPQ